MQKYFDEVLSKKSVAYFDCEEVFYPSMSLFPEAQTSIVETSKLLA